MYDVIRGPLCQLSSEYLRALSIGIYSRIVKIFGLDFLPALILFGRLHLLNALDNTSWRAQNYAIHVAAAQAL